MKSTNKCPTDFWQSHLEAAEYYADVMHGIYGEPARQKLLRERREDRIAREQERALSGQDDNP